MPLIHRKRSPFPRGGRLRGCGGDFNCGDNLRRDEGIPPYECITLVMSVSGAPRAALPTGAEFLKGKEIKWEVIRTGIGFVLILAKTRD